MRWNKTWKKFLADPKVWAARDQWGQDQDLLANYLWADWGNRMTLQHDAYTCAKFPDSIGFPTQREEGPNNFVQAVFKEGNSLKEKCPERCRRRLEWEYC